MIKASHVKLLILVTLLGLAVYINALEVNFIWDDIGLVLQNYLIRDFKAHLKEIFTQNLYFAIEKGSSFFRPLQTLSFAFDYAIWKLQPFGYHLFNILLHLANVILLYLLLFKFTKNKFVCFFTALIYVVHPIHVEAVTYIAGRADLLVTFFILIASIYLIKFLENKKSNILLYIVSLVSYILSLLSKEIAIVFPAVILLYLLVTHRKKIYLLPYLVILVVYIILRTNLSGIQGTNFGFLKEVVLRTVTFISYVPSYFKNLIFPFRLHMSYAVLTYNKIFSAYILYVIGWAILILVWFKYFWRKNKPVFWASAWFIFWLLPQSNIFPINAYFADHFVYIPSMGFFFVVVFLISKQKNERARKVMTCILGLVIFIYAITTVKQNFYWGNQLEFFKRIARLSPRSFSAFNNLGLIYEENNHFDLAEKNYKIALGINPGLYEAHINLGRLYNKMGNFDKAKEMFYKAINIDGRKAYAYSFLGYIYLNERDKIKAAEFFDKAVSLKHPASDSYHNELGMVYRQEGRLRDAIEEFEAAIADDPGNPAFFDNLGTTYRMLGMYEASVKAYERALKINPQLQPVYNNLGIAYALMGNNEAESCFKRALEIFPRDADACFNLGLLYLHKNEKNMAKQYFEKALNLRPEHKLAKEYLGKLK